MPPRLHRCVLALVLLAIIAPVARTRAASGTVNVFYAASLTHVNESLVGPAFSALTGYTYQGKGAGSVAIANQVAGKIAVPDVIELADPAVNRQLMGPQHGSLVSWYFTFARSELVIGFDPRSHFAPRFRAVQRHRLAWYAALETRGMRLGRTDPNLDPKGYRTLFMARLAEKVYHIKRFAQRVFGSDQNPQQIFPEEVLAARILTGQLDAGVFYLSEARELGIPFIRLPAPVNMGDPRDARLYATQHFTTAGGTTVTGAPILFTITIPRTVRDEAGAEAFVSFVLGGRIRSVAAANGLLSTRITLHGSRSDVPQPLVRFIGHP